MTELCRVWADLAADPDNAAAVATARARLTDLAAHMGTCDACALISEWMPLPDRVNAVLGAENVRLSPEELKELREFDRFMEALDDLEDAVSLSSRAAEETSGRVVEEIDAQNKKILNMMAAMGVTGVGNREHEAGYDRTTSITGVVQRLRLAERRKEQCLTTIANAPAAMIRWSESAMQFQAFAAASLALAARHVIELEKLGR